MTEPGCVDPAVEVIDEFTAALAEAFDPDALCPPVGGGSTSVRFFAGDGALPAWNPHGKGCDGPFLWVRLHQRYRSQSFPDAFVGDVDKCRLEQQLKRVLAVEVGVGRCTTMEAEPDWATLDEEAAVSLDDSWRIELVLATVVCRLRSKERAVAIDTVAPFGPEGGIVAWTGMAYVQI